MCQTDLSLIHPLDSENVCACMVASLEKTIPCPFAVFPNSSMIDRVNARNEFNTSSLDRLFHLPIRLRID